MNKYIVEFIGTFFLVLTVGLCVIGGAANPPLAIGSILMVMIYAGGHISGAHYNPAVTLAVFMRGKCSAADVPVYMIVQIIAGVLAALVVAILIPGKVTEFFSPEKTAAVAKGLDVVPSLLAEFLGTFALCWVVLNSATSKDHPNNSFYGLAIGFTVLACAFALGPISGGAFNPAVAMGVSVAGLARWADIWIYLVPEFAAGALAAIMFKITNTHDND